MTRKQIDTRQPSMTWKGYGQYTISCLTRGKEVNVHSTDSQLYDRFKSSEYGSREFYGVRRELINKCK
jgi:hypothetical protein